MVLLLMFGCFCIVVLVMGWFVMTTSTAGTTTAGMTTAGTSTAGGSTTTNNTKTTTAKVGGGGTGGTGGKKSGWFCIQLPKSWSVEALPVKLENGTFYCEANAEKSGCNHHTSTSEQQCNEWLKTNQNIGAFPIPGGINDHRAKTAYLMTTGGKCEPYCAQIGKDTIQSIYDNY